MIRHLSCELPIRSKIEMAKEIALAIAYLHQRKNRKELDQLLQDLRARALYFDETVQTNVLIFCEQIQFQSTYDPWQGVTQDIERAADRLLESLGWTLARKDYTQISSKAGF